MSPDSTTSWSADPERIFSTELSQILLAREYPFGVDWQTPALELTEHDRLLRLARVKAVLPEDNASVEKNIHNVSIENYIRLALLAAGDVQTLGKFLFSVEGTLTQSRDTDLAQQVFWIWAPAAEIAGFYEAKTSLEDLAFEVLMPEEHDMVRESYDKTVLEGENGTLGRMCEDIQAILDIVLDGRAQYQIEARSKSNYSVWRKLQQTKRGEAQLFDLLGFRIIIDAEDEEVAVQQCYAVKAALDEIYGADPKRVKDYIVEPKATGYQSIHLTAYTENGLPFEVQIRTQAMHHQTLLDRAQDHQVYDAAVKVTPGKNRLPFRRVPNMYKWRNEASALMLENGGSTDGILGDNLMFFRTNGNLYILPIGGNLLDASFYVHSREALKTKQAFVNGRLAPLDRPVRHGDAIEFSYGSRMPTDEERFNTLRLKVNTIAAAKDIERGRKRELSERYYELGRKKVLEEVGDVGLPDPFIVLDEKDRYELMSRAGAPSFRALLVMVGAGERSAKPTRIVKMIKDRCGMGAVERIKLKKEVLDTLGNDEVLTYLIIPNIGGQPDCKVAGCCSEKIHFGDDVVVRTSFYDGLIKVHLKACKNVQENESLIDCHWERDI